MPTENDCSDPAARTAAIPSPGASIPWMLLTFLFAAALILPTFAHVDYSTNDRGRDLYTALLSSRLSLPYRDYDWPYGPVMPFYYAACYRLLGIHMLAYEAGEKALILLAAGAMFLLGSGAISGAAGFAFAMAFLCLFPVNYLSHTGNHVGGTLALCFGLLLLMRELGASRLGPLGAVPEGAGKQRLHWLHGVLWALLALVKLNIGIAFAAGCVLILAARESRSVPAGEGFHRRAAVRCAGRLAPPVLAFLAVTAAVYVPLVIAAPRASLARCFPWLGGYHNPYGTPFEKLAFDLRYVLNHIKSSGFLAATALLFKFCRSLQWLAAVLLLSAALALRKTAKRKADRPADIPRADAFMALLVLLVVTAHEFLLAGAWYSIGYWCVPAIVVSIGLLLDAALGPHLEKRLHRTALWTGLAVVMFSIGHVQNSLYLGRLQPGSLAWEPVAHPRGRVLHVRQSDEPVGWAETVTASARHIEANTKPDEPILVVPMDSIYLFLTNRPQVCRLADFSRYQHVTPREERVVIASMRSAGVRYVLWTNTTVWLAGKCEQFGSTHCRTLGDYLRQNFRIVDSFGQTKYFGMSYAYHGTTVRRLGAEGPAREPWSVPPTRRKASARP